MILRFDGANSRIDCGNNAAVNNIALKTVCGWVYLVGWGESTSGFFVIKGDTATTSEGWYFYPEGTSSVDRIRYNHGWSTSTSGRASWYSATTSMSISSWRHIAVTYDRGSTANDPIFYIDGVVSATTETTAPSGTVVDESSRQLRLGGESGGTRNFDGYMEDVRVFNRILTAQEIAILAGGYDGPMGSEVAWYAPRSAPVVKYERLNKVLDFEEGTTADFDSTAGTISASATALRNGSYGMLASTDNLSANYGIISTGSLPNLTQVDFTMSFKLSSDFTIPSFTQYPVIGITSVLAGTKIFRLDVSDSGGGAWETAPYVWTDADVSENVFQGGKTSGTWPTLAVNTWYTIKIVWKRATGAGNNDGIFEFFIDGIKRNWRYDIDNDTVDLDSIRVGLCNTCRSQDTGAWYFDDISYTAYFSNDIVPLYALNTLIDNQSSRTNTGTPAGTAAAIQQYASTNTKMRGRSVSA